MDEQRRLEIQSEIHNAVRNSQSDLLNSLTTMLDARLDNFQRNIQASQKTINEMQLARIDQTLSSDYKFKKRGNEEQHKHNNKVFVKLHEASDCLDGLTTEKATEAKTKILEGMELIKTRQKLIKLADSSKAGWKAAEEYSSNPLAENSDDEKKIRKAQDRAEKKLRDQTMDRKRKLRQSATTQLGSAQSTTSTQRSGKCFKCGIAGHWRKDCVVEMKESSIKISAISLPFLRRGVCMIDLDMGHKDVSIQPPCVNDSHWVISGHACINMDRACIDPVELHARSTSPYGKLRSKIAFWKEVGANEQVVDVIEKGYKLPLFTLPDKVHLRNNRSALLNTEFVSREIQSLLDKGCIEQVTEMPFVVNPLTVAFGKQNKPRLVLDARHINPHLFKFRHKYEDASTARDMFSRGDYVFSFDLKSAYHHIEIFPQDRTYLGFQWDSKFYVYKVLPFGISTAGYIFTKVVREMVKYWRSEGKKVIMYLDDGFSGSESFLQTYDLSIAIQNDLEKFGFVIAHEKCNWVPVQVLTWLGFQWNMIEGKLRVSENRIEKLRNSIQSLITYYDNGQVMFKVKSLASVVGQIISNKAVFGDEVSLRSRYLYDCIMYKASWNAKVMLSEKAVKELKFWLSNINQMKDIGSDFCHLTFSDESDIQVFTDASDTGFGGHLTVGSEEEPGTSSRFELVGTWCASERTHSSTWRELEAVNRVLRNSVDLLVNKRVKVFNDNKNVSRVIQVGSRKPYIHDIVMNIHDLVSSNNIKLHVEWIPRESNVKADILSRIGDCNDWEINNRIFEYLDSLWGPHTCDRFACSYNAKCNKFNSRFWCKGTSGVDAFKQCWSKHNNWLVPPPSLALHAINKLNIDNAEGTLVVPVWKSAPYWSFVSKSDKEFKDFVINHVYFSGYDLTYRGLKLDKHVSQKVLDSGVDKNSSLYSLCPQMCKLLLASKSDNTNKSYFYAFKRWELFILKHGFCSLPAQPIHVALYLTHLLDQGSSTHVINTSVYGIKWAHELNGLSDPTKNSYVTSLVEASKRVTGTKRSRKDPVTSDILIELCEMFIDSDDLLNVRDLTMILIGYSGFLRFDELSSLTYSDVEVKDSYLVLYIRKSKTDQYRQGNQVLISKGMTCACPYAMYIRYVSLAGFSPGSNQFLFRPIFRSGGVSKLIYKDKKLSYTRTRECIVSKLKLVSKDLDLGLHSLRSGGVTTAANRRVNERCLKRHGRWKCDVSKDGYIVDSIESRLQVSQSLGL